MPDLMCHPWIAADGTPPLKPHPFPNKLTINDINEDIVEHMVHALKVRDYVIIYSLFTMCVCVCVCVCVFS